MLYGFSGHGESLWNIEKKYRKDTESKSFRKSIDWEDVGFPNCNLSRRDTFCKEIIKFENSAEK